MLAIAGVHVALSQEWVQITGALWQAGGEGGLREIEAPRRGAEVGLCGRLHAEGLVAVEDGVEVHLEDLVLRVLALQLDRKHQLARLAVEAAATGTPAQQVVLDQLLGDGAAALGGALVEQVVDTGRDHPHGVDGTVVVKVLVLDRDSGVSQVPGHLVEGDDRATLLVALFQQGDPVTGVDAGRLRQVLRAQVVEAGQLSRVGVEERSGPHDHGQQAGGREQQDAAEPVRSRPPARRRASWSPEGGMASRAASPAPGGGLSHGAPGKRGHWAEGYPTFAARSLPRSPGGSGWGRLHS